MNHLKICVNDRNYSSWDIFDSNNFNKVQVTIDPLNSKLFSNDVFLINNDNSIQIIHSSLRSGPPIPGVLILTGNKTYGRQKNSKNNKLLYKCIPDDVRLPPFLIPYEMKNIGFSKVFNNMYVTFIFSEWTDKHPHGKLSNVIGDVDVLDNFYEYQLYCKSLNSSIQKFNKDAIDSFNNKSLDILIDIAKNKYPNIVDRTNQNLWHIITIDPLNSYDYDDGFSIIEKDDDVKLLSIYISNVTVWMEILNLWNSFSRRISTIYLPDKKRPMLPTILSEGLCSLFENVIRIAFVMDITIKNNHIIDIKYSNCFIKVFKNYRYEETSLLKNHKYQLLLNTCKNLSQKIKYMNNIKNSHDIVCYLMILMNYYSAKELIQYNTGIFRSTVIKKEVSIPNNIPDEVSKFIKIWHSAAGQYINGNDIGDTRHELLNMDAYIHITSPIRRLVDLLNMAKLQEVMGLLTFSENAINFYNKWLFELEYINTTMRSIRKVQCDCTLLDLCNNNPNILENEYDGYIFDKIIKNDGLYQFIVYIPELKLSTRITMRENFSNYECKKFKLFLFNNEENFKKKIRLHLL